MDATTFAMMLLYITSFPCSILSFEDSEEGSFFHEDKMKAFLATRITLSPDMTVPIGAIYGPSVNWENFIPGPEFYRFFYDNPYLQDVSIHFDRFPDMRLYRQSDVKLSHTQSALDAAATEKLTVIVGEPFTGKTTTLRNLLTMHSSLETPKLSIYVDLKKVFHQRKAPPEPITLDYIVKSGVTDNFQDLIGNMVEVNPSNTRIMLDDFDRLSPLNQKKIAAIIAEFIERGMHVSLTTTTDTVLPMLTDYSPAVIRINNCLTSEEFDLMSDAFWRHVCRDDNSQGNNPRRARDYAIMFRQLYDETPLPRVAGIVRRFMQYTSKLLPFPSEYKPLKESDALKSSREVLQFSDHVRALKNEFFTNLLDPADDKYILQMYGPQALKMIFQSTSTPIDAELQAAVRSSDKLIKKLNNPNFLRFMKFIDGQPVDFIHEEYKRFFAANYLGLSYLMETPLNQASKEILLNPKHIFILEHLECQLCTLENDADSDSDMDETFEDTLFSEITTPELIEAAIDHFLEYRFDNLCSYMFELMVKKLGVNHLKNFLNSDKILKCKNKYAFGMLSEIVDIDSTKYFPRKTPWQISGTREELIVNLELTKTDDTVMKLGYKIDPALRLIYAAKNSEHDFMEFITGNPGPYPVEVLNRALYESVNAYGVSNDVVDELIHLGANPREATVNGRTLAHAVAKFCDQGMMLTIRGRLQVPLTDAPDANGQTILFEVLDHGMALNGHTTKGAWQLVAYLLSAGDMTENIIMLDSSKELLEYSPDMNAVPESFRKLLIYDPSSATSSLTEILDWYIPLSDLDLPPGVLSIRRKLIMKNCIKAVMNSPDPGGDYTTLTELVLSHRAFHEHLTDQHSYLSTIRNLFRTEAPLYIQPQRQRIFEVIAKHAKHLEELIYAADIFERTVGHAMAVMMEKTFFQRINNLLPLSASITDEDLILQTRYDFNRDIEGMLSIEDRPYEFDEETLEESAASACII